MNPETVNVSTGPVQISKQVQQALSSASISHRSKEFHRLYHDTTDLLCKHFNAQKSYLLT